MTHFDLLQFVEYTPRLRSAFADTMVSWLPADIINVISKMSIEYEVDDAGVMSALTMRQHGVMMNTKRVGRHVHEFVYRIDAGTICTILEFRDGVAVAMHYGLSGDPGTEFELLIWDGDVTALETVSGVVDSCDLYLHPPVMQVTTIRDNTIEMYDGTYKRPHGRFYSISPGCVRDSLYNDGLIVDMRTYCSTDAECSGGSFAMSCVCGKQHDLRLKTHFECVGAESTTWYFTPSGKVEQIVRTSYDYIITWNSDTGYTYNEFKRPL